jgi:hypothetical protein
MSAAHLPFIIFLWKKTDFICSLGCRSISTIFTLLQLILFDPIVLLLIFRTLRALDLGLPTMTTLTTPDRSANTAWSVTGRTRSTGRTTSTRKTRTSGRSELPRSRRRRSGRLPMRTTTTAATTRRSSMMTSPSPTWPQTRATRKSGCPRRKTRTRSPLLPLEKF